VQVVLGMELAATSSAFARPVLPTVWLRMAVKKVWDNALKNLQMVRVVVSTTRSFMSALVLYSECAARALGSAVLTRNTVVCLAKASSDHAWHRARMELVHGIEDIPVWAASSGIAAREAHGVETLRIIAVFPQAALRVRSTIHTWAFAQNHEMRLGDSTGGMDNFKSSFELVELF
jgi:hypothetical protein